LGFYNPSTEVRGNLCWLSNLISHRNVALAHSSKNYCLDGALAKFIFLN
jgi:hypothetical protein